MAILSAENFKSLFNYLGISDFDFELANLKKLKMILPYKGDLECYLYNDFTFLSTDTEYFDFFDLFIFSFKFRCRYNF